MNITKAAIEHRQFTIVLILALCLAGIYAYFTLPRAQDPGFTIRRAQVITYFPGASPSRIESLITDKIEKAIQEMPEIDYITSESRTGISVIYANVKESYKDMRPIWDTLRRKVDKVKTDLPQGALAPIINDEFGDVFDLVIGITGDGMTYKELKTIAEDVRNEFIQLNQVAKVDIYGAQEENIYVEYDNSRLADLGLSPAQLVQIIGARNIVNSGGELNTGLEKISLEPAGNFESLEELRKTLLPLPSANKVVALEDIARVYRAYKNPPSAMMHCTAEKCLGLAVSLRKGGNVTLMGQEVRTVLTKLKTQYPLGVEFHELIFQSDTVNQIVDSFIKNLKEAVIIVIGVTLVFLGLRTGLVVSCIIPVTILTSLWLMKVLEIGLDQVSLAALIIALGILVDNGIVVAESMMVQMESGKNAVSAAIDSAQELKIPLLTSSLIMSAAFLPVYLAESVTGEYVAPIFKVVTITLLCSWVFALAMTTILGVMFIKIKPVDQEHGQLYSERQGFYKIYRAFILTLLRNRFLTLAVAISLFVLANMGFEYVPKIFFPPKEDPAFLMEIELPESSPLERTTETVAQIESYMKQNLLSTEGNLHGIKSWVAYIGESGPVFTLTHIPKPPNSNYAFFYINTDDNKVIENLINELNVYTFEKFPDVTVRIKRMANASPSEHPIEIRLSGRDLNELYALSDQVKKQLNETPGTRNISDNWGMQTKKVIVTVDETKARQSGLTHLDIATSLQMAFSGIPLTQFREEETLIPVIMRSINTNEHNLHKQQNLSFYSQSGASVPAAQVADIKLLWQPGRILHRDRLKTITVSADLAEDATAYQINEKIITWLSQNSQQWALGYRWTLGGEWENSIKANSAINEKLPVMAFIIVLLMMAEFNCIRRTIIVLLTVPLAVIGVSVGLLITGSYMGFMTLLGIISLAGIITNNAIILLERIDVEVRENALPLDKAIIEAAQSRLRPIFLTKATATLGLFPLWLSGGPMWEPMAISVIFGLLIGSLLTLGIVPVLFSLLFKVKFSHIKNY